MFDTLPRRGSGGSDSYVTENVVSQILTAINGLEELNNVLIMGATNRQLKDLKTPTKDEGFDTLIVKKDYIQPRDT